MNVLSSFVPLQQDQMALKRMYERIQQFAQNAKNIHLAYIETGNESALNTAFDTPSQERRSTAALMGGSITRQIIRNGHFPVLAIQRRKGARS